VSDRKRAPAAGIDHELRVGSSAHYDDPAYYAKAYGDREDDIAYYVALATRHGGPVLEYGCGSGRILLPCTRRRRHVRHRSFAADAGRARVEGRERTTRRASARARAAR
jgi:hypothetical protein